MANHELTKVQIAALRKLGEKPTEFYQKHIPVSFGNIHVASTPKSLKQLSIAIAVDVYTSGTGRARLRSCYDCIRQMNIRGKYRQGNLESYIRQLDENVRRYLTILCNRDTASTSPDCYNNSSRDQNEYRLSSDS